MCAIIKFFLLLAIYALIQNNNEIQLNEFKRKKIQSNKCLRDILFRKLHKFNRKLC